MKEAINFRKAILSDLPFLLQLRLETMEEYLVSQGINLSVEQHQQRIVHKFECGQILVLEGREIGFLKMTISKSEYKILQFQIAKKYQGRSIGTEILKSILANAKREDSLVHLSVLKGNKAQSLYERLGFVKVDEGKKSVFMTKFL